MSEQILLVDVDSKIPNLVLMKLSTYYKNKGCDVKLERLGFNYYKNKGDVTINAEDYDKVFASIIFNTNKGCLEIINCDDVSFGGTGYDIVKKLPQEIDDCDEDYSIYPDNDVSYGFITRGCIRNCFFCYVPKKEGMIHKYREVEQIKKHRVVKFLDNNILAWKGCEEQSIYGFKIKDIKECFERIELKLLKNFKSGAIPIMKIIKEEVGGNLI